MFSSALILPLVFATTTAEISAWTDADYQTNRTATIVGQVLASNISYCILEDTKGRICFFVSSASAKPTPGERIRASCKGTYSTARQHLLVLRHFTSLGTAPLAPPQQTSIAEIQHGRFDYAPVRIAGKVIDVLPDEIEPDNTFLTLTDGQETIRLAVDTKDSDGLLGARIEASGYVTPNLGSWRLFFGRGIEAFNRRHEDYIAILAAAPKDPFDVRPLADLSGNLPRNLAVLGSRRITGRVTAVWHGDRLMLDTGQGPFKIIHVRLEPGQFLPAVGDTVESAGFLRTDLFSITLVHAHWRKAKGQETPVPDEEPQTLTARQLLTNNKGSRLVQVPFHGQTVRIRGIARNVPTADLNESRLQLQDGDFVIPVDASSCPEAFRDVTPGCEIEVTGVCLLMADSWRHDRPVPSIHGLALILRTPADIRVLVRPPWWTPARLLIALGILLAVTVFFFIWNRILRHLVIRRSRELAREQIARDAADLKVGERTRLAVELHDSLSQNLEGLACQVTALEGVLTDDPATAREFLTTARQMLSSCRAELRSCLFDLRGHALEASTFTAALRTTLKPFAATATVGVRFDVRTSLFNDTTVHAVLCIVRELAANAIRHGHAAHVRVAGEYREERLRFSVEDDGCGFDPATVPGVEAGHFGLSGVRTRVERLGGTLELTSAPGQGTYARVTIPMKTP